MLRSTKTYDSSVGSSGRNVAGTRYCSWTDLSDDEAIQISGTSTTAQKKSRTACRAATALQRRSGSSRQPPRVRALTSALIASPPSRAPVPERAVLEEHEAA